CCAQKTLSKQQDFLKQCGKLQEELEVRGYLVAFYPKFHCEFNWIEYYWGHAKWHAWNNCNYNIESL
ncbi:hypothetical protein L873DRAFT_1698122, partial [Choiromyces venosus 120613-1]